MTGGLKILLAGLLVAAPLAGQDEEPEATVGYLRIITDTDLVQIFIDGEEIGYSPIQEKLTLTPGWHTVSFFPSDFKWTHWTHRQRRTIVNVIESGTHHVLVEPGEQAELDMEWHAIERRLAEYESSQRIGGIVGVSMVAIIFILLARAL